MKTKLSVIQEVTTALRRSEELAFLQDPQIDKLSKLDENYPDKHRWLIHEICNELSIRPPLALQLMGILAEYGFATQELVVYHKVHGDVAILFIPAAKGLPILPFSCIACGEEIESYDDLLFDLSAKISKHVELE